jgi:hypothetical protein
MSNTGPGKFEGNASLEISEYLYMETLQGSYEEAYGSVTEPPFFWQALVFADASLIPDMKPAYIVVEDSFGFFSYHGFDTEEAARSRFMADLAAYESHYANWGDN